MRNLALCSAVLFGISAISADVQTDATIQDHAFVKMPVTQITPAIMSCGMKVETSANFIWWKTTINGLEYGASGVHNGSISVGTGSSVEKGKIQSASFDYEPGFKVALGLFFDHDGWDIKTQYTWLNPNTQSNSISLDDSEGLVASYGIVDTDGGFGYFDLNKASSFFSHHFNVVDAMLGRDFFVSKYMSLKPQIGVKIGWTKDKYNINYTAYYIDEALTRLNLGMKQQMVGAGVRAGLGSLWHISKNWSFYSDLFFSGLWGCFDSSQKQSQDGVTTCNNSEHIQKIVNVIEYGIGLNYATWFYKDAYQFYTRAGWEQQIWLGYNNLVNINYVTTGNMNIQGLSAEVGFAF